MTTCWRSTRFPSGSPATRNDLRPGAGKTPVAPASAVARRARLGARLAGVVADALRRRSFPRGGAVRPLQPAARHRPCGDPGGVRCGLYRRRDLSEIVNLLIERIE